MAFSIASSLYTGDPADGAKAGAAEIRRQLGGDIDLLVCFFSNHYVEQADALAATLQQELGPRVMIGCQGESIVGRRREIEGEPALSLWAARLPGVGLRPLRMSFERTPDGGMIVGGAAEAMPQDSSLILLADPFSFPADLLAEQIADRQADCVVAGGMASGAQSPGLLHLIMDGKVHREGAVAVLVESPARLRCVVSQGCRPIGQPMVVTKAEQNLILELGGVPALQQLDSLFHTLPNHEQRLAQRGLHIGRVINEYQEAFSAGDFLIRNVMGIDPETNAVAASDYFRVGQTVQFHLRDQESSSRELHEMLAAAQQSSSPAGGLLFTCNGRGSRMFDAGDHDAQAVDQHFPDLPVAGLFAQGELGPVGGRSFLHGFTACLALLEDAGADQAK